MRKIDWEELSKSPYIGTFKDNLKAPIHNWFRYSAGYSYRLIDFIIQESELNANDLILDPFAGSGTTCLAAKNLGISSIGIEANPIIAIVAKAKCFNNYDLKELDEIVKELKQVEFRSDLDLDEFPELVRNCFADANLSVLKDIRDKASLYPQEYSNLIKVALLRSLKECSTSGGFPYSAPKNKYYAKNGKSAKDVFPKIISKFVDEIKQSKKSAVSTEIRITDARLPYDLDEKVSLVITSPPYCNNLDYAEQTRLELYFFNEAKTYREITERVRNKLVVACTYQTNQKSLNKEILSGELLEKAEEIKRIKATRPGKKNYDAMVLAYFSDMYRVLQNFSDALKKNGVAVLVLGDSAPYGVHIPTDKYLGELALQVGFSRYKVYNLRERGNKWNINSQKHKVPLKECLVIFQK